MQSLISLARIKNMYYTTENIKLNSIEKAVLKF